MSILFFIFGVLVGTLLAYYLNKKSYSDKACGNLRIVKTDPDGPYIFLELFKGVPYLEQMSHVYLNVKITDE